MRFIKGLPTPGGAPFDAPPTARRMESGASATAPATAAAIGSVIKRDMEMFNALMETDPRPQPAPRFRRTEGKRVVNPTWNELTDSWDTGTILYFADKTTMRDWNSQK